MACADGGRQHLRDQIEIDRRKEGQLFGLADLVLVEGGVVSLNTGILYGRARESADIRQAAAIAERARRAVRGARRDVLVHPGGLVVDGVVLPERTADGAHPPVIRRAQAQFVLLVRIALSRVPSGTWRVAL